MPRFQLLTWCVCSSLRFKHAVINTWNQHAAASKYLLTYLIPGARVLDVGCGSGYTTGLFHVLTSPGGAVVGIDHIPALTDLSKKNLVNAGFRNAIAAEELQIVTGDGRAGHEPQAPFDAIHVGAAAPEVPQALLDQLKAPGRMFIPVGETMQRILLIDKDAEGKITQEPIMDVMVRA